MQFLGNCQQTTWIQSFHTSVAANASARVLLLSKARLPGALVPQPAFPDRKHMGLPPRNRVRIQAKFAGLATTASKRSFSTSNSCLTWLCVVRALFRLLASQCGGLVHVLVRSLQLLCSRLLQEAAVVNASHLSTLQVLKKRPDERWPSEVPTPPEGKRE